MKKALLVAAMTMVSSVAFAEEAMGGSSDTGMVALAAAIAICIASFGGAFGQGMSIRAALEGIARNPAAQSKVFMPMIIGLALIESLVLFAFVIANTLAGKI
jgi:F-type H+-transporting ATPase subunit c